MAYETWNLFQKTFVATNPEQLDGLCNDFKKKNSVKFSTALAVYDPDIKQIKHIAVCYYLPKEEEVAVAPVPVASVPPLKEQPKAELWCSCTMCLKEGKGNIRMKYSHFERCKNGHGLDGIPEENKEAYKKIWNLQ